MMQMFAGDSLNLLLSPDSDEYVKKNVAILIREVVKHTPEVYILV